MLLPQTTHQLGRAKLKSVAFTSMNNRTLRGLALHGQCMDIVRVQASSIDGAGMGAFAKRLIKKGSLVVPAPLYVTESRYDGSCASPEGAVCHPVGDRAESSNNLENMNTRCYGHINSSLLFCPLSAAAYINHSADNGKGPNAQYQWTVQNKANHEAHQLPVEIVLEVFTRKLFCTCISCQLLHARNSPFLFCVSGVFHCAIL